jgi:hypothetical protein
MIDVYRCRGTDVEVSLIALRKTECSYVPIQESLAMFFRLTRNKTKI